MKTEKIILIVVITVALIGLIGLFISIKITGKVVDYPLYKNIGEELSKDVYKIYDVIETPQEETIQQDFVPNKRLDTTIKDSSVQAIKPYYPESGVKSGKNCDDCTDRTLRQEVERLRERVKIIERQSSQCSQNCVDKQARDSITNLERRPQSTCPSCDEVRRSVFQDCMIQSNALNYNNDNAAFSERGRFYGQTCQGVCESIGKTCTGGIRFRSSANNNAVVMGYDDCRRRSTRTEDNIAYYSECNCC